MKFSEKCVFCQFFVFFYCHFFFNASTNANSANEGWKKRKGSRGIRADIPRLWPNPKSSLNPQSQPSFLPLDLGPPK